MDTLPKGLVVPVPAPDESEAEAVWQFYGELIRALTAGQRAKAKPRDAGLRERLAGLLGRNYDLLAHIPEWQALTNAVTPALCTALAAWLGSRNGRKVRIKVGDIEAEAQTRKEAEELIARAQEIQQRNQPPKKRAIRRRKGTEPSSN